MRSIFFYRVNNLFTPYLRYRYSLTQEKRYKLFWQDETSTIESETQRPRQTRFQLLERSESQKYSSADDPLYVFFRTYLSVNLSRVTVVCKLIFNNIVSYNHKSLFKLYIYQKSPYNHFIYFLHRQKYLYQN